MTALLVGNFLSATSGATRQVCEELADRLGSAGLRVLTTSGSRGKAGRLADIVSSCWRWRREYDIAQVDVFSGPAFSIAEAACWTLRRAGKPYVLTLHGGGLPQFLRRWPRRARALLESARAVTAPSRFLYEELRPYRADMVLLPNAIDLASYPYRHRSFAEPKLTWLRAFHTIYNPAMAVRVAAEVAAEFPGLTLTMTGPDKGDGTLEETQALAGSLGVAERIRFEGPVTKTAVPAKIGAGDIYLNTTTFDNMPVTVLEAMAVGACVVSTNVGGIPYLLDHGRTGLLVPSGDAGAMAAAVKRLLREPDLAAKLSRQGRGQAEEYDWRTVLPRWLDLLAAHAT